MNERVLILAAIAICPTKGLRTQKTIDDATAAVKLYRERVCGVLGGATLADLDRKWYEADLVDCDAWLAAAKLHEEQKAMAERMRAAIAAASQETLSDAEMAECVAELDQAMAQTGRVSNGEVLLAILEKASLENLKLKALMARAVTAKKKTPKGTMITPDCAAVRKLALALDAMEAVVDKVAVAKRPEFKDPPPRKRAKGRGLLEIILPGCASGSGAKRRGKKA